MQKGREAREELSKMNQQFITNWVKALPVPDDDAEGEVDSESGCDSGTAFDIDEACRIIFESSTNFVSL